MRKNITTNTPSEKRVGYSRAVIINNTLYISGTTSLNEKGDTIGKSVYDQSVYCFEKIKKVIEKENYSLHDVVVVRAYLVNMKDLTGFDKAFNEYFGKIHPTCTLIGINSLVKPDLLIEIEITAER